MLHFKILSQVFVPAPFSIHVTHFHSSTVCHIMPSHKLFPRVDWDKVEAGSYAVVDPVNTGNILYLSEQDYVVMIRVALTSNRSLKVLAQPGDTPSNSSSAPDGAHSTDPSSQNSPYKGHPWLSAFSRKGGSRALKKVKYQFHSPFSTRYWKGRNSETTMIQIHEGNLMDWLRIWSAKLHFWARGFYPVPIVHRTETMAFGHNLLRILKTQGIQALILRLKICLFAVNSYMGGTKLSSTQDLGFRVRLTNGLPILIPLYARSAIRGGNMAFVRIWVSLLNSYKGFAGEYELPPLATITQPHPDLSTSPFYSDFLGFITEYLRRLRVLGCSLTPDLTVKNFFYTNKAGPNHPNSVLGSGIDAFAWTRVPRNLIREWLELTGQKALCRKFREIGKMVPLLEMTGFHASKPVYRKDGTIQKWVVCKLSDIVLGRLHALYEAAGKVRVVAIVDYWTQLVLKPVHQWMFSLLRRIPTDATFDQEGKVKAFAESGYKEIYSLDLKAATDTIPMGLYTILLTPILGRDLTILWSELLVERDFLKPRELRSKNTWPNRLSAIVSKGLHQGFFEPIVCDEFVRYTTGQPMGALSSWASMALCHHLLVQYAAHICGHRDAWYLAYLVLGDDVVIADGNVAYAYQHILASFGIKVGLAKSFISQKGMFNFANQSYVAETNISPLSFREELGISSLPQRLELALRAVRRGWIGLQGNNWLSGLLRLLLTPAGYRDCIADLRVGKVHPYVSWATSVLFCPGVTRLSGLGIKEVSINTFLACITRKMSLWSKPIAALATEVYGKTQEDLILVILREAADRLYKQFLESRAQLKEFERWLTSETSVSVEYVLQQVFKEQRATAFDEWSKDYREFVKTLQIAIRMLPSGRGEGVGVFLLEHTLSMPVDEIFRILTEAETEIPLIPDFKESDASALTQRTLHSQDSLDRFLKVARVLGAVSIDDYCAHQTVVGTSSKPKRTHS